MDKGIWRVARARLCVACLQEMAVVEDVKGMRTREYAMKAKLFRSRYGFAIREV